MLSNRWLRDHIQIAENCQILYVKFSFLFKNTQRKIATKIISTLCAFTCTGKFLSVPRLSKNTLICYNLILYAVL